MTSLANALSQAALPPQTGSTKPSSEEATSKKISARDLRREVEERREIEKTKDKYKVKDQQDDDKLVEDLNTKFDDVFSVLLANSANQDLTLNPDLQDQLSEFEFLKLINQNTGVFATPNTAEEASQLGLGASSLFQTLTAGIPPVASVSSVLTPIVPMNQQGTGLQPLTDPALTATGLTIEQLSNLQGVLQSQGAQGAISALILKEMDTPLSGLQGLVASQGQNSQALQNLQRQYAPAKNPLASNMILPEGLIQDAVGLRIQNGKFSQTANATGSSSAYYETIEISNSTTGNKQNLSVVPQMDTVKLDKDIAQAKLPVSMLAGSLFVEAQQDGSLQTSLLETSPVSMTQMSASPHGTLTQAVSSLTSSHSYAVSNPITHQAAAAVEKMARNASTNQSQSVSFQLDPPELGRLQVDMKYKKGEPLKVHVVLEKADTLSMFQRDQAALEQALSQAGFKNAGSSLSFSLSQDQHQFHNFMSGSDRHQQQSVDTKISEHPTIETTIDVAADPRTGRVAYNVLV
jgi:hypothetical protein